MDCVLAPQGQRAQPASDNAQGTYPAVGALIERPRWHDRTYAQCSVPSVGREPSARRAGTIISTHDASSYFVGADAHIGPCWHFVFAANQLQHALRRKGLLQSRPLAVPAPSEREPRGVYNGETYFFCIKFCRADARVQIRVATSKITACAATARKRAAGCRAILPERMRLVTAP